eukprot:6201391-Pleurochrysis_carterae.AAC.4
MLARLADVVPSNPRRRYAPTPVLLVRGVRTARTGGLGEIKMTDLSLDLNYDCETELVCYTLSLLLSPNRSSVRRASTRAVDLGVRAAVRRHDAGQDLAATGS